MTLEVLPVDNIIICAGQELQRELEAALRAHGKSVQLMSWMRDEPSHRPRSWLLTI